MGCDIHGWIEIKYKYLNGDIWKSVMDISYWERNYVMFARLFGVRNYPDYNATPIASNRGIPTNTNSDRLNPLRDDLEYWEADGHSHSYITLKEIKDNKDSILKTYNEWEFTEWERLFNIMESLKEHEEQTDDNIRLVVWFDN